MDQISCFHTAIPKYENGKDKQLWILLNNPNIESKVCLNRYLNEDSHICHDCVFLNNIWIRKPI